MWGYWTLGVDRGIPGVPPEPCCVRSEHRLLLCLLLPTLGGAGGRTERHRDGPCWEHIPYTVGPLRELTGQEGVSTEHKGADAPHAPSRGAHEAQVLCCPIWRMAAAYCPSCRGEHSWGTETTGECLWTPRAWDASAMWGTDGINT